MVGDEVSVIPVGPGGARSPSAPWGARAHVRGVTARGGDSRRRILSLATGATQRTEPSRLRPPHQVLPTQVIDGVRFSDLSPSHSPYTPVLFLHGLGNSLDFWTATLPPIAATRRAIALDIPGFGMSRLNGEFSLGDISHQVIDVLAHLNITRFSIVAHSLGTYLALKLSSVVPSKVHRIVLVDGPAPRAEEILHVPHSAIFSPGLAIVVAAQFLGGLVPLTRSRAQHLTRTAIGRRALLWAFLARPGDADPSLLSSALAFNTGRSIVPTLRLARTVTWKSLADGCAHPVCLIRGEHDRLVSAADTDLMQRVLDVRCSTTISGSGHWPMLEFPEKFLDALEPCLVDDEPHCVGETPRDK